MIRKTIRVHRKHSAFVYAILESLEGMTSYSTVNEQESPTDYRDLELWISPDCKDEVEFTIESFRKKFPVLTLGEQR